MESNKKKFNIKPLNNASFLKSEWFLASLLAVVLLAIPLDFAFGSIACISFLIVAFFGSKKTEFEFNLALFLPISFYFLMVFSVLWSIKWELSVIALQKELLFLLMPIAFLVQSQQNRTLVVKIIKIYSYGMVCYAIFYFASAYLKFEETQNKAVFYFHELVTLDLNAIFMASMASIALFYLVQAEKQVINQIGIIILVVFIFFLSSKSVIFIDIVLIIWYYIYFSETAVGIKSLTLIALSSFFILSFAFVPQIKERFFTEYETAFVDNTINKDFGEKNKVFNISLKQAWTKKEFLPNDFFPGTALRVFQIRIFKEMMLEHQKFVGGFGLNATQDKIREKSKKYNIYSFYGDLNFHNQYIQTFSELGFIGFLILVMMLSLNLKNAINAKDFLHIVFAFSMIVLFLTESFFCRQRGVVFFITLYCIFNSVNYTKSKLKSS